MHHDGKCQMVIGRSSCQLETDTPETVDMNQIFQLIGSVKLDISTKQSVLVTYSSLN